VPEKKYRTGSSRRLVYTIAPLLLLLGVLFILNWLPRFFVPAAPTSGLASATVTPPTPAASPSTDTASSTPISPSPQPSATATVMPTSPLPPTATIRLLGPPPATTFAADDIVTFYWQWPPALTETQHLTVYLVMDGEEQALDRLTEPNVGLAYWLQISLEEYPELEGQLLWQVKLEDPDGISLRTSELRPLVVSAE